jgi:2-polyprenyl-3-methyl-5-hydroxy-6-metoxy-1,4-benzoquinol methylase
MFWILVATLGGGKTLKSLLPRLQIVGMDVSPEFVAVLPPDVYARGITATATAIKADNESFDVVLAGEMIEHLFDVDVEPAMRECYRVLRPKGQLLLTTPNPTYFKLFLTGKASWVGHTCRSTRLFTCANAWPRLDLSTSGFADPGGCHRSSARPFQSFRRMEAIS